LDGESLAALRAEVQRHDDEVGAAKLAVEECEREIDRRRDGLDTLHRRIAELGGELKRMESRRSSLEEIQAGALGRDDPQIRDWLERHGLGEAGQLADRVRVDGAWKRGVEAYLGDRLAAVCIDDLDGVLEGGLPDADLTLVDRRSAAGQGAGVVAGLLSHVDCGEFDLAPLLGRARTVASLAEAALLRAGLGADECLVTADGVIVGRNWLRTVRRQSATGALLSRAEEIDGLVADIAAMREDLARTSQEQERQRADLRELEGRREHLRAELAAASRVQAENHNRLGREEEGFELGRRRGAELDAEIEELEQRLQRVEEQLGTARQHLDQADAESGSLERRREELQAERADLVGRLEQAELHVNDVRETLHACDLERQRTETELRSLQSNLERLDRQRDEAEQRIGQLRQALESGSDPVDELNRELSEMLARRDRTEKRLAEARNTLAGFERSIRSLAESRQQSETDVSQAREDLERERMQAREVEFRIASLVEEAAREKHDIDAIVAELPEDAEEQAWVEKADNVAARIARIGPVNLVAIEEFDEQSERKSYLDKQHADLSDALTTLESVMRRIDRETKTRFRETFDQLNEGFRQYFPELFGGGQATLELTEDDLLSAGVTVMARPPGKRNSTIHLLSGGEKALTAVALLFSLFRLNPAPFCLLDEVDAPLDDANVERYCRTLRTLCERSQLVVITHNKITMEAADVLIGVTMAEPGVSRLVSVDLSQAVEMAAV
jgi:chromosome segregation protein